MMSPVPSGFKPASNAMNFVSKKMAGHIKRGDLVVIEGDSCRALNDNDLRNNDLSKLDISMAVDPDGNERVYVVAPN